MIRTLFYSYAILTAIKSDKKEKLPELGSVKLVHAIPNRLRLYSEKLKNSEVKKLVLDEFKKINLIKELIIDERTGSLLINYDSNKIDENLLFLSCVRLIDGEVNEENFKDKSIISKELKNINNSLDNSIYTKTQGILDLHSLLVMSLLYFAFISYKKNKNIGLPSTFTLLFWTYEQIKEKKWT